MSDFLESNKLSSIGDIQQNGLRNDREAVDYTPFKRLLDSIEILRDNIETLRVSMLYIDTNPLDLRLPSEIDPDTVAQFSSYGSYKRVKVNGYWELYMKSLTPFGQVYYERLYMGKDKPVFPDESVVMATV
jgi:hypothetical protein